MWQKLNSPCHKEHNSAWHKELNFTWQKNSIPHAIKNSSFIRHNYSIPCDTENSFPHVIENLIPRGIENIIPRVIETLIPRGIEHLIPRDIKNYTMWHKDQPIKTLSHTKYSYKQTVNFKYNRNVRQFCRRMLVTKLR